jgi:hypothetical protein
LLVCCGEGLVILSSAVETLVSTVRDLGLGEGGAVATCAVGAACDLAGDAGAALAPVGAAAGLLVGDAVAGATLVIISTGLQVCC